MYEPADELLTPREVCRVLKLSQDAVRRWARKGNLHPVKMGSAKNAPVRYRRSEVDRIMQEGLS